MSIKVTDVIKNKLIDPASLSEQDLEDIMESIDSYENRYSNDNNYSKAGYQKTAIYKHIVQYLAKQERLHELKDDSYKELDNVKNVIDYQIHSLRKKNMNILYDDLFQAGYEGYLKAKDNVDPSKGIMTIKFASQMIRYEILKEINKQMTYGRRHYQPGDYMTLDRISNETDEDTSNITASSDLQKIRHYIGLLPEIEADIISSHYLSYNPRTLVDIGKDYGLSKERIRQLKERALTRLKSYLEGGQ